MEESPVGDHRANGEAENVIKQIDEKFRVLKSAAENRVGIKLKPNLPALKWMVEYTSVLINRYQVGSDGKTS